MSEPAAANKSIGGKGSARNARNRKKKWYKQKDRIFEASDGNISDSFVKQLREKVKTVRRPKKEYDCVKPELFCRYFLPGQVNNRSHASTQTDRTVALNSHETIQPTADPLGRTPVEKESDSIAMKLFLKKLFSKHSEPLVLETFQSVPLKNRTTCQPPVRSRFTASRTELIFLFATLIFSTFSNAYFLTCLILVIVLLRIDSASPNQSPECDSQPLVLEQQTDSFSTAQRYPAVHQWFENRFVTVHLDKISAKDMDYESNYIFGEPLLDGESFSFQVSDFSVDSLLGRSIAFGFTSVKNPLSGPIVSFMPHLSEFTDLDGLVWSFDPNLLSDPLSFAQVITIRRVGQIIWLKIGDVSEQAILSLPIGTAYPFFCFNGSVKEIQMMRSDSDVCNASNGIWQSAMTSSAHEYMRRAATTSAIPKLLKLRDVIVFVLIESLQACNP